jgi:hypothetical protein
MMTPFIAVLITDFILLIIAFGMTKENSKYLLSGYNTMSEKERKKFDIENYLSFLKRFLVILTSTSTLIFFILVYFFYEKIAVMSYASYLMIMLIWFVFKGTKFKLN